MGTVSITEEGRQDAEIDDVTVLFEGDEDAINAF